MIVSRTIYIYAIVLTMLLVARSALAHEHGAGGNAPVKTTEQPSPRRAAAVGWTRFPGIVAAGRGERGGAVLAPLNSDAAELSVISPDTAVPPAAIGKNDGRWRVQPPQTGVGGYHWLLARETSATEVRTASTLWMFPGKGPSPESLLAGSRSGLIIQPVRIPQFGGFREGSTWEFLIRFDGVPLPGASLSLDTENGSHETAMADERGLVRVSFPRDFDPASFDKEAGAARTRRIFAVGAEVERDGIRHIAGFNQFYLPDLMRERNLPAGAGLFALGMVLALPMLRRKQGVANA